MVEPEEAKGKLKQAAGALTGDETAEAEGRAESRSQERKTYRVVEDTSGEWRVEAEEGRRASSVHRTKDEAVSSARELARNQEPSQILVYRKDGSVEAEHTYG